MNIDNDLYLLSFASFTVREREENKGVREREENKTGREDGRERGGEGGSKKDKEKRRR